MVDRQCLHLKSALVAILAILVVTIWAPSLFNARKTSRNMTETIAEKNQKYWESVVPTVPSHKDAD